jgi:sugar phosphate isomerase/epimerase
MEPIIALPNFISQPELLRDFALEYKFKGVEWTFVPENLPLNGAPDMAETQRAINILAPFEIRFHAALPHTEPGHEDEAEAQKAVEALMDACRMTADLGGKFLTIHLGLGLDSTEFLSWGRTVDRLTDLRRLAQDLGITLCLENLAWGWTSRPNLFEKIVRQTGVSVTLDIGHAQVCESITSRCYDIDDFVAPHPHLVKGAHIYHEEQDDQHLPPSETADIVNRLDMLWRLPDCTWWLLELRNKDALVQTREVIDRYLHNRLSLNGQYHVSDV